jgi:hypothetical protein
MEAVIDSRGASLEEGVRIKRSPEAAQKAGVAFEPSWTNGLLLIEIGMQPPRQITSVMVDRLLIARRIFRQSDQIIIIFLNLYYIFKSISPDHSPLFPSDSGINRCFRGRRPIERIEKRLFVLNGQRLCEMLSVGGRNLYRVLSYVDLSCWRTLALQQTVADVNAITDISILSRIRIIHWNSQKGLSCWLISVADWSFVCHEIKRDWSKGT